MTSTSDSDEPMQVSPVKKSAWHTFLRRGLSTVILLTILILSAWIRKPVLYFSIITVICFVISCEWLTMLKASKVAVCKPLILIANTLYPVCLYFFISPTASLLHACYIFVMWVIILTILAFAWELRKPVEGIRTLLSLGATLLSFVYPVGMMTFGFLLLLSLKMGEMRGEAFFLWILLVTKMTDIGAYISGSLFGGKIFGSARMIPHISPNKTWEGLIGSCVITVIFGYMTMLCLCPELETMFGTAILCLMIVGLAFLSVIGDLAGSVIKRSLGVKDSGALLPGIGGFFDLVDSPAFTFGTIGCVFFILFN